MNIWHLVGIAVVALVLFLPAFLVKREDEEWKQQWTQERRREWLAAKESWEKESEEWWSNTDEERQGLMSQVPPGYPEENEKRYSGPPPWESEHHPANQPRTEFIGTDDSVRLTMEIAHRVAGKRKGARRDETN